MIHGSMGNSAAQNYSKCEDPNIFIGNIDQRLTPPDILAYLANFDLIAAFEMPCNPGTGNHKGFAKAQVKTTLGVDLILSQPFHAVRGCPISIKRWLDKRDYLKIKDETIRRKLFVTFDPILTEDQLHSHFSQFGNIEAIECKSDPVTKKPRHFGFILFSIEADAIFASMWGEKLSGKQKIWCNLSMPKFLFDMLKTLTPDQQKVITDLYTSSKVLDLKEIYRLHSQFTGQSSSSSNEKYTARQTSDSLPPRQSESSSKLQKSSSPYDLHSFAMNNSQGESIISALKNTTSLSNLQLGSATQLEKFTSKDLCDDCSRGIRKQIKEANAYTSFLVKPTCKAYPSRKKSIIASNHKASENIVFRVLL